MTDTNVDALVILRDNLLKSKMDLSDDKFLINQIELLIITVEQKIKSNCQHDYVEDYIDIDLDRSQKVCYCNKCFTTFEIH